MAYIVAYRKHIDHRTVTIALPAEINATELATIAGVTYVSIEDGVTLPTQPTEIAGSVAIVDSADRSLMDVIKASSPHVQLINTRVVERIRQRYSIDDEIKMIRIAPSDDSTDYVQYVEECRDWGRQEKAKLGFVY